MCFIGNPAMWFLPFHLTWERETTLMWTHNSVASVTYRVLLQFISTHISLSYRCHIVISICIVCRIKAEVASEGLCASAWWNNFLGIPWARRMSHNLFSRKYSLLYSGALSMYGLWTSWDALKPSFLLCLCKVLSISLGTVISLTSISPLSTALQARFLGKLQGFRILWLCILLPIHIVNQAKSFWQYPC